jgi:ABC-type uncharacterized transport system permease subunit
MILALSPTWVGAIAALAAGVYALLALWGARLGSRLSRGLFVAAWLLHALSLAEGLFGQPPRFGFAPALSMTLWLVLTVAAIEHRLLPRLQTRWAALGLGAVAVLLPLAFPGLGYPSVTSPWLPLHWTLGIASYGLFGAAVVHGWLMNRAEKRLRAGDDRGAGVPLLTLERLTFRFVEAGFVLLTASLLAGWYFAEGVYSTQMRSMWNHKTVFSMLAWLTFAGLLLGRLRQGWRGRQAVRVLYLGAGFLLLSYLGSRFVMEVILQRA